MAVRIIWYDKHVLDDLEFEMRRRLRLVGAMCRSDVVRNISIPVYKQVGTVVTMRGNNRRVKEFDRRSRPGEYPRADTTRLMKSIFWAEVSAKSYTRGGNTAVIVGTDVFYGLIHEIGDRPFLRRTPAENWNRYHRVLVKPFNGTRLTGRHGHVAVREN